jgi:hypothetical protein
MDNEKVEKVNKIIDLTAQLEYIWPFHPDNPEKINVEEEFELLMGRLQKLQSEVDSE